MGSFFDIVMMGDEDADKGPGTAASGGDAVHGHADAAGSSIAEDRRCGGLHVYLRSGFGALL
jgi:hypothetical protein